MLGILTSGPAHGHGMWARLSDCDIEDWAEVSRAQVYYSIKKLAEQNLICPVANAPSDTAREKQTWRITREGRNALRKALASDHWITSRRVQPFITWVGWSELATAAARRRITTKRKAFLEQEVSRERATLAEVRELPADTPALGVTISMIRYAIRQYELELEWLDELARMWKRQPNPKPTRRKKL
ncbi:MAG: PadR family transcriptional regulator [Woeseiaceae bacterium]|nr:PadR family transcriptional regulator [Woeseiaceae bacterium]